MSEQPTSAQELTAVQREELLRRSWMATDGLWFYQTAMAKGVDGANEANIQVVREFGRQEMLRLMRSLGVEKVETAEQYRALYDAAVELYLGSLFSARDSFEETAEGTDHTVQVDTCFAHKGVERAGIAKEYHCGPGERLTGWLQAMELPAALEPGVGLCQKAHTGSCSYLLRITLPAS
ncbi:hypothetical protein ABT095_09190 [Kitasatospora sp. NPDC002227]|uniref:hypothetical protein n=1 Tax=Kitasatospora sp. NPDC002227 TaxID=3154773 RepID=UPI003319AF93